MKLGTKEHAEIMEGFEQYAKASPALVRFEKESKEIWKAGHIYQDGKTNDLFKMYCAGYSQGRCAYLN